MNVGPRQGATVIDSEGTTISLLSPDQLAELTLAIRDAKTSVHVPQAAAPDVKVECHPPNVSVSPIIQVPETKIEAPTVNVSPPSVQFVFEARHLYFAAVLNALTLGGIYAAVYYFGHI
jgi:hypothetical protein